MKYFLQRDGRSYGPYSYDDLKRYQSENRIGPNDLVRSEDSQQWEPWQQVLNPAPAVPEPAMPPMQPQPPAFGGGGFQPQPPMEPQQPQFGGPQPGFGGQPPAFGGGGFGQPPGQAPYQPQPPMDQGFGGGGFGQPPQGSNVPGAFGAFGAQGFGGPPQQGGFGAPQGMGPQGGFGGGAVGPMPPDMQWWLVLLIGVFCSLFMMFWVWKQATFVKKIDPNSDALKFYGLGFACIIAGYCLSLMALLFATGNLTELAVVFPMLGMVVILGGAVCLILAHFKMRKSIHDYYTMVEPMGINLMDTNGAIMTFFFNILYFQYHFGNIAERKKAMGHPAV